MKSSYATVVMALAALASAGCGQKGNLYLPNQKKPVPATRPQPNTPPATAPASEPPKS
jgi:predicted small lipoprotein YifL